MNDITDLGADSVRVDLEDARSEGSDDIPDLCSVVAGVMHGEGVRRGTVNVYLVDRDEMATLNSEHMGHDGPTDVLSFPMDDPDPVDDPHRGEVQDAPEIPHLGEMVLCVDVAVEQAPGHSGSLPAELHLLSVHGALHLLGHDHTEPAEKLAMQTLEAKYLSQLGYEHPGDHR